MIPTIEDVKAAAKRIEGIAVKTPLIRNDVLDEITGAKVWVKAENLQRGGAFKMRGATNAISALAPEVRAKGVIAASAGNHAQGLAYHGRRLGVPATIVMPVTTPTRKGPQAQNHGARVILIGRSPSLQHI
mgnify:CR=1 FL=1